MESRASTDADLSRHSIDDESIKSFTSSRSAQKLGYSSGGSTPDDSSIGSAGSAKRNPKTLGHSSSIIGLDSMIENRREDGDIRTNVVHMEVPFGKPIEEVYDGVHTGPVLGSGISGMVRLVTHKKTGHKYAVKCLDLGLVDTEEGLAQLREEIFIMCQLDHPNIVRLEEVYESHTEIYLVQELCVGGELFDRLDEQPDYHYTEAECARLVKQMLCAVRYLHSKGIIHRDLKLENFLFSSNAKDSELKMIDFGLSKHFRYGEMQHEAVGTPYTVAPEVIRGSYDERCDIWAIGVISFLLLSGEPPFGGCGGPEPLMTVRSNILRGNFDFQPADVWGLVSQKAKKFICALLVIDPKARPTAREAQKHAWLREWASRNRTDDDNVLNPNVVKALVNFKEFSDMRKLLCEVLSFTLLPDQIKDLRKEFEKMDTDGSGEISLAALKQVLVTNASEGSLGALTEEEVEDVFNAMRVKKTETRIHWHEFIAAGLSQCQVDDRNLRLAFDRLDSDHKGYVTLDDIMNLVGNDSHVSEENMRKMWGDSVRAVNSSEAQISFDEFLLLMKGQTREIIEGEEPKGRQPEAMRESGNNASSSIIFPKSTDACIHDDSSANQSSALPFVTPLIPQPEMIMKDDFGPLSMDTESNHESLEPIEIAFPSNSSSVETGNAEASSNINNPSRQKAAVNGIEEENPGELPTIPLPKPGHYVRKRSRSFDDNEMKNSNSKKDVQLLSVNARRAVALPEVDSVFNDETRSALQVNRQLYRAHRQMRLAVTEASKRFEEQQTRHARNVLLAQEAEKETGPTRIAGLVMRRVENKTVSSEAVKKLLEENRREQQSLMEVASKRGGRGRRTRKKTISDMSGMMGSLSQDDLNKILPEASAANGLSSLPELGSQEQVNDLVRGATVPGEFKKVRDPFGVHGKYGNVGDQNSSVENEGEDTGCDWKAYEGGQQDHN
eukprot:CAMPEP_0113643396 /NCGR_PEP_ID=MMETSP0017_2-20120614/22818_1 /TAXON_ID=2856 /ORGANISM="Cylindrotheca closterium" /LENGTH=951 /DNA_ID=CAMNT_0000554909 /DNA_START=95 /DNA_END=2948 /DNA_ORIENTATION=+ /assembly_acc=CAM_ASM_000147